MKTYAIANRLDQHTYTLLNKAGVKSRDNIYNMSSIPKLLELVEIKDRVVVVSIGVFGTCSNLVSVLNILITRQVSFISLSERLKCTSSNQMKHSYKQYIMSVLNYEQRLINDVEHIYRHQDNAEMIRRINMFSLYLLIETLKNDGILQK